MAAPDAIPPRRRRRLVKTVAAVAWLTLYAVMCVGLLIGGVSLVGFLGTTLHR